MHLKHFAGAEPKGHVWTYDAVAGTARSAIPEETGVISHFYSIERDDGVMDTRIEEFLAKAESEATPIYEGLIDGQIPAGQAKADFAQFLALTFVRTTAMRKMAADMYSREMQIMNYAYAADDKAFAALNKRIADAGGPVLDDAAKEQVRQGFLDPSGFVIEVAKEPTLQILGAADKLSPLFYRMNWSLLRPAHGFFITSDNPLVRQVHQSSVHPFYGDQGFMNQTALISFPLTPKLLLMMSWMETRSVEIPRHYIEDLNRARASHSDRFIYAHLHHKNLEKLAAEFKDSRPGMTTSGFGPEKFAESRIRRRSGKAK
jgi:hypothetical protein